MLHGNSQAFEQTALYRKVYQLESPKITRKLTTARFAQRVDARRAQCMAQK